MDRIADRVKLPQKELVGDGQPAIAARAIMTTDTGSQGKGSRDSDGKTVRSNRRHLQKSGMTRAEHATCSVYYDGRDDRIKGPC